MSKCATRLAKVLTRRVDAGVVFQEILGRGVGTFVETGGSIDFVCADFRSTTDVPGPFDAVVAHYVLQGYGEQFEPALDALLARLRPGGLFVASFHNAVDVSGICDCLLRERGFVVSPFDDQPWTAAVFLSTG